jgi:hypothetical protein
MILGLNIFVLRSLSAKNSFAIFKAHPTTALQNVFLLTSSHSRQGRIHLIQISIREAQHSVLGILQLK